MLQTGSRRDLRVDYFRGVSLWWIFVDHIPANWVSQFSLRNFALCDATEIFVLLAGYAAGTAYVGNYVKHGWLYSGADVTRRVWTLYIAHIFLFVVFSAQVSYSATALDRSDYLEEIHLDVLAEAPYRAMLEALFLSFQPAYLNILPLYVALLGMFAVALPLATRPIVLGTVSFALYVAARSFGWNFPSWNESGWYFNPLAWQLLFFIGVILSRHPPGVPIPKRVVDLAALIVVFLGFVLVWLVWPSEDVSARMPVWLARTILLVDKQSLHPMRLLSILAWVWLVSRTIPFGARWLARWPAWPFTLCGQHSLPVFCAGIFLSFLGRLVMEQGDSWLAQLAVNLFGPIALLAVALLAAWYRDKARTAARADLPAPQRAGNAEVI